MSTHLKEVRKQDMYAKMGKFSSSSFSTTWLKQRGQKKNQPIVTSRKYDLTARREMWLTH